ncbi:MAG: HAD family hydrolase [Candidatus Omnitrophota bacterium]|nr:HAD family hydrolase [Candidatus Omnitrophota bacterium]
MSDKYVFFDRDGVINRDGEGLTEHGYITRWEDFQFLPGVLDALKKLTERGYRTVVVSNQKCVGKGIMSEKDLTELTERFTQAVEEHGGKIDKVYYCPHLDEDDCDCRKPAPGLFLKAREELGIENFDEKFFIGDSERDMQAGKKAGLKTILVTSGKSTREDAENWKFKPDHICGNVLEAVDLILRK